MGDMRTPLWRAFLLCPALLLVGCSATQEISDRAQAVHGKANTVVVELDAAKATGEVGPAAMPHVDAAQQAGREIGVEARSILSRVPDLTDKQSPIVGIIRWTLIVAACVVALIAAIYFNIGAVARPAFALFGRALSWLIPAQTATAAKLDAEAVASGTATEEQHRVITVRRTTEPGYDAAFRAARANAKPEKKTDAK